MGLIKIVRIQVHLPFDRRIDLSSRWDRDPSHIRQIPLRGVWD
jgi:hypothetical protein